MIQLQQIRTHSDELIKKLQKKHFDATELFQKILEIDEKKRATQKELDDSLSQSKNLAKEIGILIKEGNKEKVEIIKEKTAQLKELQKTLEEDQKHFENQINELLPQIPNIPADLVPFGKTPEDNTIVGEYGKLPEFDFEPLPHWDLATKFNLINFELGTKITGAGFPVYIDKASKLQRALISFFLDKATEQGYVEHQVPHMVNADSAFATGQLPDKEGQMYHSTIDNLYLIPTAEVPLTNIYRDTILKPEDLPIKLTGYTPCFRREAGSYGKDVRGLNRLHQFDKVEIVQITEPQDSYNALESMKNYVASILDLLKLPYRILLLCGGDMGFTSAMTYDFEVYSAAQQRWLEVSSVSNFENYQANRLKLRYKNKEGVNTLLHTLNGSALALPRILASILENYQTNTGIIIPDVLVPYTRFSEISL